MSYFKKFTDLIGGIACFIASVFFIEKYMSFTLPEPDELEEVVETRSKLEIFLSGEEGKDYRAYIILIALLILSVAVGRFFKKFPIIPFCVSVLPLFQVMNMINNALIYEYETLFVILTALHIAGGAYELVLRDNLDGRKRTFVATGIIGILAGGACLAAKKISAFSTVFYDRFLNGELVKEDMDFDKKLSLIGLDVIRDIPEDEQKVIMTLFVMLAVGVVLGFILRGAYFIDLAAAAFPFCYVIYCWQTEKLISAPMLVIVPIVVYFIMRVILFITGAGLKKREEEKTFNSEKGSEDQEFGESEI